VQSPQIDCIHVDTVNLRRYRATLQGMHELSLSLASVFLSVGCCGAYFFVSLLFTL